MHAAIYICRGFVESEILLDINGSYKAADNDSHNSQHKHPRYLPLLNPLATAHSIVS